MSALGSLAWTDVAEPARLLVIPLGATEQHGPHLPLDTDTTIASAIAHRLGAEFDDIVVAPAVPYGSSGEHQDFAGTLSIGQAATELVVLELVRSAARSFDRVLLLSTHGGNAAPVTRAVVQLRDEGRDVRVWSPAAAWSGDAHAGLVETSVMLAVAPQSVQMSRAAPGATAPLQELLVDLQSRGVASVSANGVLGDPRLASAGHGVELLVDAVDQLKRFIVDWPVPAVAV
jgi:mycofactocin system creatininase family protein